MKKLLILCLLLLCGCTNTNLTKIEHQDIFDKINIDDYQNIMFVAHPDDETIWGGTHFLQEKYLVICLTNGNNSTRSKEFKAVMDKTPSTGIILDYPDKTDGKRDNWNSSYLSIENDIKYLLSKKSFNKIVTHNPDGEYGHQHHKLTSEIVTNKCIDLKLTNNLNYFGKYYSKDKLDKDLKPTFDNSSLNQKKELSTYYNSQKKVCNNLEHMFPYENWISYDNWK